MKSYQIVNKNSPLQNPLHVKYCSSFLCQLRGFMFTSHVNEDFGLLLVQSTESRFFSSIHMLFVFINLAVIWVDSDFQIVDKIMAKSWNPFYASKAPAKYVLEINPSRLEEFSIGDHLELINE